MRIETFFETLWEDYIRLAPQAEAILALLSATYSTPISNDHVAFRTFGQSPIDIGNLSTSLHDLGYQKDETYQFEGKKLDAVSFVGPTAESPLIFVSELRWWELPPPCREIIEQIINEMTTPTNYGSEVFTLGRLWEAPSQREYTILAAESEYASWLTVHGLHANHFTVSINSLPEQTHLAEVVSLLEASGFILNKAGGVIKGKKDDPFGENSEYPRSVDDTGYPKELNALVELNYLRSIPKDPMNNSGSDDPKDWWNFLSSTDEEGSIPSTTLNPGTNGYDLLYANKAFPSL